MDIKYKNIYKIINNNYDRKEINIQPTSSNNN